MNWHVGIDLGTTNSSIASYNGDQLRLHKSPEQNDVTPSALWFDPRGNRFVGQRAYTQLAIEPQSGAALFKRLMGSKTPINLPGIGRALSPEECSAEVLRTLYGYLPSTDTDRVGTVITVPAAFDQVQKEATLNAATLAGIGAVALMQEPVAAVMSVMRAAQGDGRFLIYDMGGGTLDVALAESISGRVTLLAHGGIAVCGGRDFDRQIVDRIVIPWLHEVFAPDPEQLKPGGRIYRMASLAAERAKVELSGREDARISLSEGELRARDRAGAEMYLDIPIHRSQLDPLISSQIAASIEAAREVIQRAGLTVGDVERIVFVGGPTLYGRLRDQVAAELRIPGVQDVNAMTAVAEGAAIFAESIDWQTTSRARKSSRGTLDTSGPASVSFKYTARTPDQHAKVLVQAAGHISAGCEFQIDSVDTGWSSGRVRLEPSVTLSLPLAKRGDNFFKVFMFSPSGAAIALERDRITIQRTAATVDAIPASHSIGIEVLERVGGRPTLTYLVRIGDPLPKKGRVLLKAAETLKAGMPRSLNVKLWEGEIAHPVTDNRPVGAIRILGTDLDGGVIAAGAELQCDYEVLDSGTITITVTVPSVGATFNSGRNFYSPQDGQIDLSAAADQVGQEAQGLVTRIQQLTESVTDPRLTQARGRAEAAAAISPSADPESCKEASDSVQQAKQLLAQVRKDHLKPTRELDLQDLENFFTEVIREHARPSEATSVANLFASARRVITRDDGEFENYLSEVRNICSGVLWRQDWWVADCFNRLRSQPHLFTDKAAFSQLVDAGQRALSADDFDTLRVILDDMFSLKIGGTSVEDATLATNVLRG